MVGNADSKPATFLDFMTQELTWTQFEELRRNAIIDEQVRAQQEFIDGFNGECPSELRGLKKSEEDSERKYSHKPTSTTTTEQNTELCSLLTNPRIPIQDSGGEQQSPELGTSRY